MSARKHLLIYPQQAPNDSARMPPNNPSNFSVCVICGDKARFNNYGALSCQSCKTFFRRNGFRPEIVRPCTLVSNCEINMQTRHSCTYCRLSKCFAAGMASDLIRKEDLKSSKRLSSTKNTQITTTSRIVITRFQSQDRTILSDSQWTLLSNIVHAYDTCNTISHIKQILNNSSKSIDETTKDFIEPMDMLNQICKSVILFISSLPDFRILTQNEQISLLNRNLHGVMGFYSTFVFRQIGIFNHSNYVNAFEAIYGMNIISAIKHVMEQLDFNETTIKIALIILTFSSESYVDTGRNMEMDTLLYGTFRLLGSQNVYVELLWKYLTYQYGYGRAAARFAQFIQIVLCITRNLAMLYVNNEIHRRISDTIVGNINQMLVFIESERIPLWGKGLPT
ncbi:unnamed protein product [Adineta ricciae]|uniref:Nuclear receptor domain-containing protein n=1 Tax=Adineta ricciae TaxID=249248 RepID=A0A815KAQ0_ADIRI|nr:unnamed protein product [Adineta ricciae]CAF1390362.1 unnamed protein product [Adineta ricciae]